MNNDKEFIKLTEQLYDSLQKKETFSPLIQQQIKTELEKIKQEAIQFYNKNKQ